MRYLLQACLAGLVCACGSAGEPARPTAGSSSSPSVNEPAIALGDAGSPAVVIHDASAAAPAPAPGIMRSTRSSLQWKRYATFENDLSAALELEPGELCREFGTEQCVRGVHLGPLGGHDIKTGLLESPPEPLVTTPTVVERVVLSACLARLAKESKQGSKVFAPLDLHAPAPAPESEQARALITALVRRFLARDPSNEELAILGALALDQASIARSAPDFASSVCLALGSTTEFLFF